MRILTGVLTVLLMASAGFAAETRVRRTEGVLKLGEYLDVKGTQDVQADSLKVRSMKRTEDKITDATAVVDLRNLTKEEIFVTFAIVLLDKDGNVVACGSETPTSWNVPDKARHGMDPEERFTVTILLGLVDLSSAKTYKVTVTTVPVK
jgi:hypothetical protein